MAGAGRGAGRASEDGWMDGPLQARGHVERKPSDAVLLRNVLRAENERFAKTVAELCAKLVERGSRPPAPRGCVDRMRRGADQCSWTNRSSNVMMFA